MNMRALDARVEYEKAQLAALAGKQDLVDFGLQGSYGVAFVIGMDDFLRDAEKPPGLFSGCDFLLDGWSDGFASMEESAEMNACSNCNDGTGNPCQVHG